MKILLVEDNHILLSTLESLLESDGHSVRVAMNGIAAYRLVKSGSQFDAIITDMQMPCGTGLDFIELLHQDGETIPCRLHSGNDFFIKDGKRIDLADSLMPYPFASYASKAQFGHIEAFLNGIKK